MPISIASIKDIDNLSVLFNQYQKFYGENASLDDSKIFLTNRIINKESIIYCCKNDGNISGFAQIYFSYSSVTMQKIWILNDLFVDQNFRGLGIGEKIISHVIRNASKNKIKSVILETLQDNKIAQNLYKKMLFIEESNVKHFVHKI
ncbi:hypothetical protein [uncultured Gammaproteobacteria bacterium]|jgi:ribosomal protein S18 acetylase RimI-like enzyme|nr:hypothetical protein [uncultured Gammaproteobacteria bacterium]CAC9492781.1 hypothetical protein [uncultured Gammaproteobacteria bacterium]CAC9500077.1 hypothetical protein [uncultured Gammaproteobacteria bacterium]CAC9507114.1 hypothetical protein [uncultured Gammaproteobacteria bacterium]CAC9512148.1 hypothetical protein [uncultured Gammaproteobacteria bacterium]